MKKSQRFQISPIITLDSLVYFLLSAVCIRPDYLLQFSEIYRLYSVGSLLALTYVMLHLIRSKEKFTSSMIALVVVYVWMLVSSLLNGLGFSSWWDAVEVPLISLLVCYYGMKSKPLKFLHATEILLLLYLFINLATITLFPNGMNMEGVMYANGLEEAAFFLGQKNVIVKFSVLAEFCVILEAIIYKRECGVLEKCVAIVVFATGIYTNSGVTILASFLPLLFSFIGFNYVPKWLNAVTGAIFNAVFFVFIIIFQRQEVFAFFIEGILGKTLTFTSRTRLWDRGLLLGLQHPIIGNGIEDKVIAVAKAGFRNDSFHNFIVDYFYQGGIILIILWCIFFILLYFDIKKCRNPLVAGVGNMFSFAFLIVAVSEPFTRSRITAFIMFAVIITMTTRYLMNKECDSFGDSENTAPFKIRIKWRGNGH